MKLCPDAGVKGLQLHLCDPEWSWLWGRCLPSSGLMFLVQKLRSDQLKKLPSKYAFMSGVSSFAFAFGIEQPNTLICVRTKHIFVQISWRIEQLLGSLLYYSFQNPQGFF